MRLITRRKIRLTIAQLQRKPFIYYGANDITGQAVKICTKCGCHYVGENCPSKRVQH